MKVSVENENAQNGRHFREKISGKFLGFFPPELYLLLEGAEGYVLGLEAGDDSCGPRREHEGARGICAQKAGTEPPTPVVDAVGGSEDVEGICSDVDDRGDGALLVVGSGLLQPVPGLVHDVPLG